MRQVRRKRSTQGFSLIELLIVIAIILVIIGIALPKFNVAQMSSRELAVRQEIRTINTAQVQYESQFGKFASSLAELGPPTSGAPGPNAADLIPAALAAGDKDQYTFTLTATPGGYTINANPKVYNSSGRYTFYSDQTMSVRANFGAEPASASSAEMK